MQLDLQQVLAGAGVLADDQLGRARRRSAGCSSITVGGVIQFSGLTLWLP